MLIALGIILTIVALFFTDYVSMGRVPHGKRLERFRQSPHFKNRRFVNPEPTKLLTGSKKKQSNLSIVWNFLVGSKKGLKPEKPLKAIPLDTEAINLAINEKQSKVIWFGHSSYLLIIDGKTILVDPVLFSGSPISFINKPFKGTSIYRPQDFPFIDYLVYTHDHYDHLDYTAAKRLKHKLGKVITPLGVGSHLEYWGYKPESITELDWGETFKTDNITFHCTPARHFSGRGFRLNRTLWASYVVEVGEKRIFIGGDGGYGSHFRKIGEKYDLDLAFIENGQYNSRWSLIHTMPEKLHKVMEDLDAKCYVTVHHSKFALSSHNWYEPRINEKYASEDSGKNLMVLQIGQMADI